MQDLILFTKIWVPEHKGLVPEGPKMHTTLANAISNTPQRVVVLCSWVPTPLERVTRIMKMWNAMRQGEISVAMVLSDNIALTPEEARGLARVYLNWAFLTLPLQECLTWSLLFINWIKGMNLGELEQIILELTMNCVCERLEINTIDNIEQIRQFQQLADISVLSQEQYNIVNKRVREYYDRGISRIHESQDPLWVDTLVSNIESDWFLTDADKADLLLFHGYLLKLPTGSHTEENSGSSNAHNKPEPSWDGIAFDSNEVVSSGNIPPFFLELFNEFGPEAVDMFSKNWILNINTQPDSISQASATVEMEPSRLLSRIIVSGDEMWNNIFNHFMLKSITGKLSSTQFLSSFLKWYNLFDSRYWWYPQIERHRGYIERQYQQLWHDIALEFMSRSVNNNAKIIVDGYVSIIEGIRWVLGHHDFISEIWFVNDAILYHSTPNDAEGVRIYMNSLLKRLGYSPLTQEWPQGEVIHNVYFENLTKE